MKAAALNAVCPYFTMYPLDFPLGVLKAYGNSGDWVIDPFCGRGTTNFAARLLGMPSVGLDSSPVASALVQAKLAWATPAQIVRSARSILRSATKLPAIPQGEFWRLAYHERTLYQLCQLRQALMDECSSQARILLRAIILGALHGPRPKGTPSYFSNQSPRTFAPKPQYAVKFWTERRLLPNEVDVLAVIEARAKRYLTEPPPRVAGFARMADSRDSRAYRDIPRAKLIVTSPPYYGMRTYLPDQWLRLWFLGGEEQVEYRQPLDQLEHTGVHHFARELGRVWENVAENASDGARLVIRFGGIHDRDAEPMGVLRASLANSGWRIVTAKPVPDSDTGRRQVRQFQRTPKKAITEYDVYCHRR